MTRKQFGVDRCAICGFATTFFDGDPPICGSEECEAEWEKRLKEKELEFLN